MDCFIIMPISTPESLVDIYPRDQDHFRHVLHHLFIPAVKAAKMNPIPPTAQGSDIIHAEIIKHIEIADMVLCDMSALNPNVFFELGIRTAVNKPVALVKDNVTLSVPFDTNIINNHTYLSDLSPWNLEEEIVKLHKYLEACIERSKAGNTLWKYFSLSAQVKPMKAETGVEGSLDFIKLQIDALRHDIRDLTIVKPSAKPLPPMSPDIDNDDIWKLLKRRAEHDGIKLIKGHFRQNTITITTLDPLPVILRDELTEVAGLFGFILIFELADKQ